MTAALASALVSVGAAGAVGATEEDARRARGRDSLGRSWRPSMADGCCVQRARMVVGRSTDNMRGSKLPDAYVPLKSLRDMAGRAGHGGHCRA